MKLEFWSIGKPHESYIKTGTEDFTKRINNYFSAEWKIISPIKNAAALKPAELKKQEAMLVLEKSQKDDFIIVLDEKGKLLTSPGLADLLQQRANDATKRIIFLIGGSYGVDDALLHRANFTWSLSALVFPHMLVRLILAEQVYRACTIIRNEKYHHV